MSGVPHCVNCGRTFLSAGAYLHPSHRCAHNATPTSLSVVAASVGDPSHPDDCLPGGRVIPLFGRRSRQ